jgi:hypothetical protein
LFSEPNNRRDFTFQRKRDDINFLMNFKIGLNDKGGIALPIVSVLLKVLGRSVAPAFGQEEQLVEAMLP